jgi:hypothetical protein
LNFGNFHLKEKKAYIMKNPIRIFLTTILSPLMLGGMFVVFLLCLKIFTLPAWALDFNPGRYEITVKVEMPGMPSAMPPQTMIQCLTEQSPVPNTSANANGCNIKEMETRGNTISYTLVCNQQGMKTETKGVVTYKGNSFEGKSETKMGPEAGGMTMISIIKGKRIGNCE